MAESKKPFDMFLQQQFINHKRGKNYSEKYKFTVQNLVKFYNVIVWFVKVEW